MSKNLPKDIKKRLMELPTDDDIQTQAYLVAQHISSRREQNTPRPSRSR